MLEDEMLMLRDEIRSCQKCDLCKTMPFNPVPGIGPVNAKIMCVGEAPGEEESIGEEPFIGDAGRMLNRLLMLAGLNRKSLYICNVVNCRPTEGKKNRPPTKAEIKACNGWLFKQIELVQPKVIFTLGKIPSILLLNEKSTFKLHDHVGKVHSFNKYDDIHIIPNLHPSFCLVYGRKEVDLAVEVFKKGKEYL